MQLPIDENVVVQTNSTVGPGGGHVWPSPVRDREWVDDDGVRWRMRGQVIGEREVRRLLTRSDLRVLHVYEVAQEVSGPTRDAVLERLAAFYRGRASPYADFVVAEFRDDARRALLVVQESC